jgi:hypothetical protein
MRLGAPESTFATDVLRVGLPKTLYGTPYNIRLIIILPYDSPRPRSGPEMEPGLFTHRCSHTDWMLMALKFLETALTQLSDDILHSSVYHVLHWS